MNMSKIEKIRAEIDKRYAEYRAKMKTDDFTYYEGMADALDLFEQYIDTLSEESDKSLEEAAERFARLYDTGTCDGIIQDGFIAGAEWQEEQFEKNRLAHCDALSKEDYDRETDFAMEIIEKEHRQPTFTDAINYGMRLQKEQTLKDAVEGEAEKLYNDGENQCTVGVGTYFKPGEKVYVLKAMEGEE